MSNKKNIKHISLYKTPDESPGYLLWRVSTKWRNAIEKALKPLNLTHPQFVVLTSLTWLTKDGAIVNQAAIGSLAGLDPNTTSQIIRGLEAKKLIQRVALQDERSKNPSITQYGLEVVSQALPIIERIDAQYFSALNDNELKKIIPIFRKLLRQ